MAYADLLEQLDKEREKRDRRIFALRAQGKTLSQIAKLVGVTRQRCQQILGRKRNEAAR